MATLKQCAGCGRPALFRSLRNRKMRIDKKHNLCMRCYQKMLDQERAKEAADKCHVEQP